MLIKAPHPDTEHHCQRDVGSQGLIHNGVEEPQHHCTGQRSGGINLFAQYDGHPLEKDIPDNTTADSGDDRCKDKLRQVEAGIQPAHSGINGKDRQANSICCEHEFVPAVTFGDDGQQGCHDDDGNGGVAAEKPRHAHIHYYITGDTAAAGSGKGTDTDAENVQFVPDGQLGAGDGKGEGADVIHNADGLQGHRISSFRS